MVTQATWASGAGGGTPVSTQILVYNCTARTSTLVTTTPTLANTYVTNSTAIWHGYGFVSETEAERKMREERNAKQQKERAEALERSKLLLFKHLSDKQRETFEAKEYFDIISQDRNKYRIDERELHKVGCFDSRGRKIVGSLCVYHSGVPKFDDILGIKLGFEYDESETVRIANKHPAWYGRDIEPWASP